MGVNLIIVESPAKARTITKYLGKNFKALASYGHVRDLLPKKGAVDPDDNFAMKYEIIERNKKHVDAIKKALKTSDALYLATDPDREGEAISWHLYELLKEKNLIKDKPVHRVVFYEITPNAIRDAVANPRTLSMEMINAQQARRALDYLVGFNLSPLLWKKVRRGLSAGRVQSPALRMICEREAEIEKFIPREYWTIEADLNEKKTDFIGRLTHFNSKKLNQFSVEKGSEAEQVTGALEAAANGFLTVQKIDRKERKRNPAAPFTTSTLQQEASRKLGFTAQRTMRVAQQLYEGMNVDGESVGLISYMRTDSVSLAKEAVDEIRDFIATQYGPKNRPQTPHHYKNKSKNAQEAHEAIRPTSVGRRPEDIRNALDNDQANLYDLIWKRTVASQMIHATMDTVAVDMAAGDKGVFRANGSVVKDPGFLLVYEEGVDETSDKKGEKKEGAMLPAMKEGQQITLKQIRKDQHFTEPPPRFTEASLVKTLEAYGIGRPSTYASIISTLINREYVELEQKRFTPTEIGKIVNTFLTNHFTKYVDYNFTANLEDDLDAVSRGEKEWVPLMHSFWKDFGVLVKEKDETVMRDEVVQARLLGEDPATGKPITVRMGRFGPFIQIGTKDDEEKPRFAGLRPGQKMDSVTYADAMELFKLPRDLGETPEGEAISTNFGRFGPYVKYGSKYVSLKDSDPFTVTREEALELVKAKKELDANRIINVFEKDGIEVLNGRFGPYITNGEKNARIPKETDPKTLTLEQCKEMLEAAPFKRGKKKVSKKKVTAEKATKKKATKKKAVKKKAKKTAKKSISSATPEE